MIIVREGLTALPGAKDKTLEMTIKGIRHIGILLTFTLAAISCEREDSPLHPDQEGGRPIVFTTESKWPVISKAAVNDIANMENAVFKVWGAWNQNPDDSYYSGESSAVYGNHGTSVKIISAGDATYQVQCADVVFWKNGYYSFASIYPVQFSAAHQAKFAKSASDGKMSLEYSNQISVTFPNMSQNGSYHLGERQHDLMYAFHNEDNSDNTSSVVNLNFNHVFSLLTINISANSTLTLPRLTKITIYGIHSSVPRGSSFTIAQTETITNNSTEAQQSNIEVTNDLKDLLASATLSTEDNPYKVYSYGSTDFEYGSTDMITPVKNLLVYPETLSDTCPLMIKIEYEQDGTQKVKTACINTGEWESGKSYVYTFLTD